jgi:bifunctional non-homologous end joining protein LigD
MKSADLFYQEGVSNKEYHLQLEKSGDGYVVNFQYGRVGSSLQSGTKTPKPVSLEAAEKIYNSLYKEKTGKGYSEAVDANFTGERSGYSGAIAQKEVHMLPQLLNETDDVQKYIDDDDYLAQEKKDGERRMVIATGDKCMGLNKKGTEVQLPNSVIAAISNVFNNRYFGFTTSDIIIDGEMIGEKLFVFDILSMGNLAINGSVKDWGCEDRIRLLDSLKFGLEIEVVKTAYTRAEKQRMFDELKANNKEGIVFKKKSAPYKAGRPASGDQFKFKFHKTATFIVQKHTSDKRSVGLGR